MFSFIYNIPTLHLSNVSENSSSNSIHLSRKDFQVSTEINRIILIISTLKEWKMQLLFTEDDGEFFYGPQPKYLKIKVERNQARALEDSSVDTVCVHVRS